MKAGRFVLAPILAIVVSLGCSNPVERPAASCAPAVVRLGGRLYAGAGPASAGQAGPVFGVAQRVRECQDVIIIVNGEPSPAIEPWRDGDADGFTVGTEFYVALGHPDGSRLVARRPGGEWVMLQRQGGDR